VTGAQGMKNLAKGVHACSLLLANARPAPTDYRDQR
jgi:hypothetical protein